MTVRTFAHFYDKTGQNIYVHNCNVCDFKIVTLYIFICCVVIRVRADLLYKEGG